MEAKPTLRTVGIAGLDDILDAVREVAPADLAVVLSVEDPQTLRVCAATGSLASPALTDLAVDLRQRPMLRSIVAGEEARVVHEDEEHDVHEPDTYAGVVDLPDSHTCLAAPLRTEDELVGVLTLDSAACRAFSPDQIRAIDALAKLAARALREQRRAEQLERNLDALSANLSPHGPAGAQLVGQSPQWRQIVERVRLVAPTPATVLLTGPTGTGKEQVARAIHQWSPRAGGPFVALNCSAVVPELALSELFGHEKGAFTGADRRRAGRFELAAGGTLFLDEVADLPAAAQAQLLRVVQERTFERVGGAGSPLSADVRLVAATHKDLAAAIAAGDFREDLYYRLAAFPVALPPLAQRPEDIALLAEHFIRTLKQELAMARLSISTAALRRLESHGWPGNVRELRNVLERAAILAGGRTIDLDHLDLPAIDALAAPLRAHSAADATQAPRPADATQAQASASRRIPDHLRRLDQALAREIIAALAESAGKISGPGGAAERLGVKPTTLHSTMRRLGLK